MAEIYNLPTTEMLFEEYKKAIPELLIDKTERMNAENTKLKKENANLISDHEIIAQLSDRIIHLENRLNEK